VQDEWLEFLSAQGAEFNQDSDQDRHKNSVLCFNGSSVAAESGVDNWLVPLTDYAVIGVNSDGAYDFLQAQFCNDPAEIQAEPGSPALAQLNGYCNPKGRLLALFHLLGNDSGDGYRLVTPASVAEALLKRLSMSAALPVRQSGASGMFVQRLDVEIAVSSEVRVLAVGGTLAEAALQGLLADDQQLPVSGSCQVVSHEAVQIVALPNKRWLLLVDSSRAESVWLQLQAELTPAGENRWYLASIEQGEPCVVQQSTEKFIPQMLNMQSIDALTFKKRCYPGQEIVARMQYLGKLKKRMYRLLLPTSELSAEAISTHLQVGASLSAGDDADAGTLVSVARGADGGHQCLAVLKIGCDINELNIENVEFKSGELVSELPLPYTVILPDAPEKA